MEMLEQSLVESMTELLYVPGVETVVQVSVTSDSVCDANSTSPPAAVLGGVSDVYDNPRQRWLQTVGTTSELQVIASVESTSRNSIYEPLPVENVVTILESDLNPSNTTNSTILSRLAQNIGQEVSTVSIEVIENPSSTPSVSPSVSPSMIPSVSPSMQPSVETTFLNSVESSGVVNRRMSRIIIFLSSIYLTTAMTLV